MDARQRHSKSTLSKLHERVSSIPLSARPVASEQHHCSTNYNVQKKITIVENL